MSRSRDDPKSREQTDSSDRPKLEGQMVFKGNFDESHEVSD